MSSEPLSHRQRATDCHHRHSVTSVPAKIGIAYASRGAFADSSVNPGTGLKPTVLQ